MRSCPHVHRDQNCLARPEERWWLFTMTNAGRGSVVHGRTKAGGRRCDLPLQRIRWPDRRDRARRVVSTGICGESSREVAVSARYPRPRKLAAGRETDLVARVSICFHYWNACEGPTKHNRHSASHELLETQFPVSRLSKEATRNAANYSQTLTGLGKCGAASTTRRGTAVNLGLLMQRPTIREDGMCFSAC